MRKIKVYLYVPEGASDYMFRLDNILKHLGLITYIVYCYFCVLSTSDRKWDISLYDFES